MLILRISEILLLSQLTMESNINFNLQYLYFKFEIKLKITSTCIPKLNFKLINNKNKKNT